MYRLFLQQLPRHSPPLFTSCQLSQMWSSLNFIPRCGHKHSTSCHVVFPKNHTLDSSKSLTGQIWKMGVILQMNVVQDMSSILKNIHLKLSNS